MSEKLRLQISALVDDELPAREFELLIRQVARDPQACAIWGRYLLIGDAVRGRLPSAVAGGFADRVMRAVATTAVPPVGGRSSRTRLWRAAQAAAGLAIAASVATVAIVGLRDTGTSGQGPAEVVPTRIAATTPAKAAVSLVPASQSNADQAEPEVQAELTNYLINHNDYVSTMQRQGMLPYLHVAAYDPDQNIQQSAPPAAPDQSTQPDAPH